MIHRNNPEVQFAIHTVREAARLVRLVQKEMVSSAITKEDRSPVTVADYASQALVGYLLNETFPNEPLVAEENADALRSPEQRPILEQVTRYVSLFASTKKPPTPEQVCAWIDRGAAEPSHCFWCLDPIDGTKGFLRGDQYAVALAWIVNGQVQVAAIGCPNLVVGYLPKTDGAGSLSFAVRGEGAWTMPLESNEDALLPLHVSDCGNPHQARLLRSFESGHTNVSQIDQFAQELGIEVKPISMDSQAKYSILAAGQAEVYVRLLSPQKPNYREKIWDQAAGSLLVEEAGGTVTDLDGKPLDFTAGRTLRNNRGILATNGHLHFSALRALRAIGA